MKLSRKLICFLILVASSFSLWLATVPSSPAGAVAPAADAAIAEDVAPDSSLGSRAPAASGEGQFSVLVRSTSDLPTPLQEVSIAFSGGEGEVAFERDFALGVVQRVRLPQGRYSLSQRALPGDMVWPDRIRVPSRSVETVLELWLTPGRDLLIETVDEQELPVAAVPLTWEALEQPFAAQRLETDEAGRASTRLPLGSYSWKIPGGLFRALPTSDELALGNDVLLSSGPEPLAVRIAVEARLPRTLSVEVDPQVRGSRLEPGVLRILEVRWRGVSFYPQPEPDGVFRATLESVPFRDFDGSAARLHIGGVGIAEAVLEIEDPGEGVNVLRVSPELRALDGKAEGVLLDGARRPIVGRQLDLRVLPSKESAVPIPVTVKTDEHGRFSIPGVEFPFRFHVATQTRGTRYDPGLGRNLRVYDEADLVEVYALPANRVVLLVKDEEFAAAAARGRSGHVALDLLPLTPMDYVLRTPYLGGAKQLDKELATQLAQSGEIELPDLPAGDYLATLFVASHGTASVRFTVDSSNGETVAVLAHAPAARPLIGNVGAGRARLVLDGYVPRSLLATLATEQAVNASSGRRIADREAALAVPDGNGAFLLGRHNALEGDVTVLLNSGEVRRLSKRDLGFANGRERSGQDGTLRGRVFDPDGRPRSGAVVNLTSNRGGEELGVMPWPKVEELLEQRTASDGSFVLEGILPGSYTLSVCDLVTADEGRSRTFEVETSSVGLIQIYPGNQDVDVNLEEPAECTEGHDHDSEHTH